MEEPSYEEVTRRIRAERAEMIAFGLCKRTVNALRGSNVETVAQLRALSPQQLAALPNIGQVSLSEIRACLELAVLRERG